MPTVFAQIFHTLRAPQIGNPSPDTHDITAAILQRRTTPLGKSAPASIASDTNTRSSAGSYVAMTSGQVSESSTDPEATPKAKPSALPPPSRADSKYAQALARFPCYSDAEFPKTLRDRHINHYMVPSLLYGFLIPDGTPYIARIAEELKLITLPTKSIQPAAGPIMTLSDARTRLSTHIVTKWPIALFHNSGNCTYRPIWARALDMDGAATGTVLVLYFNESPSKDCDMLHKSASRFRQVLKVTKTILRLHKEAEPRWFYHPASSRSSEYKFDLHRCFHHDYLPERNMSDSSV